MQRKKILWLASWYPNRNDHFDGDFVQRHARAAAIYHDVHVIFVTDADVEGPGDEEWNYATGLTEQIIYFRRKKGIGAAIRKQLAWKNIFRQAVEDYIEKNGLPHCVHVHVPWKAGLMALWIKRKYARDFIVTEHWGMYDDATEDSFYNKPKLMQRLLKETYKGAKAFVSVSSYLANTVEKLTGKKADAIIPNVVDTTLFFSEERKYSKFTFLHVSNMAKLKNAGGILKAFRKALDVTGKEMQLIMIGNRDDEYVQMAGHLNLLHSSVFFRGEIGYLEVAEEMRRSHSLVLFSNSETFSCVTAEALCCGVPVISPNVGALPELIDSTNGMLIPPGDEDALSIAMVEMLEKYYSFNHKKVSEDASRKFSYSTVAERFDALYSNYC